MAEDRRDALRIILVGDLFLGGAFLDSPRNTEEAMVAPFRHVSTTISRSDFFFVNLEGPVYQGLKQRDKVDAILFNHPRVIDLLKRFDSVVCLANNHIMDGCGEGLRETLQHLNRALIPHVGAGMDIEQARQPVILDKNGFRVAFLAFSTDRPWVGSVLTTGKTPGCAP